jgi:hypothetical protein
MVLILENFTDFGIRWFYFLAFASFRHNLPDRDHAANDHMSALWSKFLQSPEFVSTPSTTTSIDCLHTKNSTDNGLWFIQNHKQILIIYE